MFNWSVISKSSSWETSLGFRMISLQIPGRKQEEKITWVTKMCFFHWWYLTQLAAGFSSALVPLERKALLQRRFSEHHQRDRSNSTDVFSSLTCILWPSIPCGELHLFVIYYYSEFECSKIPIASPQISGQVWKSELTRFMIWLKHKNVKFSSHISPQDLKSHWIDSIRN